MLSNYYIKKLLNLQELNILKIEQHESDTVIYTQLPVKAHICPLCNHKTTYVHDYRIQSICLHRTPSLQSSIS